MRSDDDLITRCGEESAAAELMRRYRRRLFSFLIHRVGPDSAEDLFQEVWLRVLRSASRYEPRGSPAGWIFTIAHRLCIDHLSRCRPRPEVLDVGEMEDLLADQAPGPHALLERAEMERKLKAAVSELTEGQREVFLLREYARMPFREIAETLDIPLGTALSRMSLALKKIRVELLKDHDA